MAQFVIKSEFKDAKIFIPGVSQPIESKKPSGAVVIHAPLADSIAFELRFMRESYKRFRKFLNPDGSDILNGAKITLEHLRRIGYNFNDPLRDMPSIIGGAASAWAFTNGGRTKLLDGTFDIDSDTWKTALFLSTSNLAASSTTYAALTNEHANANGYTTGGVATVLTLAGTTTVTVDISTDPVWTASGGSIVARFAVIYEVSGNVLCYSTLDSTPADVTATTGNTLTVAANASGVFTLA